MAKANEKKTEAEKLYYKGMKLIEIARKLELSEGTVRSWKSRGKWEEALLKKNKCSVADKERKNNATLQKKKRGGQLGNQNAKGAKGGSAPLRNKNAEKHGAYSKIYWDTLDAEELKLIDNIDDIEEQQLIMQLQMFSIRERRLMKNIKKYRELKVENHGLSIKAVLKTKKEEDITDFDGAYVGAGKYKKVTETSVTETEAVIGSIMALESELTRIQKAKTKAIETLSRIRLEKDRVNREIAGSDAVDDWISAILGEDGADE